jgi:hypothetical protein
VQGLANDIVKGSLWHPFAQRDWAELDQWRSFGDIGRFVWDGLLNSLSK